MLLCLPTHMRPRTQHPSSSTSMHDGRFITMSMKHAHINHQRGICFSLNCLPLTAAAMLPPSITVQGRTWQQWQLLPACSPESTAVGCPDRNNQGSKPTEQAGTKLHNNASLGAWQWTVTPRTGQTSSLHTAWSAVVCPRTLSCCQAVQPLPNTWCSICCCAGATCRWHNSSRHHHPCTGLPHTQHVCIYFGSLLCSNLVHNA